MTDKAALRQATLISEQKVVPGTGTLTGITVSAPITGGGAGPVVPIGATQYDINHVGFVPSPGVNDHSLVLWDDGWFVPPSVTFPITAAQGGTGADLSGLSAGQMVAFDGTKFAGVDLLAVAANAGTDTATNTLFWSAEDSGNNVFNVSAGIELPNSVGVAGDWVLRTGGSGASGSGTPTITASGASHTVGIGIAPVAQVGLTVADPASGSIQIYLGASNWSTAALGVQDLSGATQSGIGVTYSGGGPGASGILVQNTGSGYGVWSQASDSPAIFAQSLSGISALFQTSATDGSCANPTMVAAGNTAQTFPLIEARGTDGTTPVFQVGITGGVNTQGLLPFLNNAAALLGGLVAGDLYVVTAADPRVVAIVF